MHNVMVTRDNSADLSYLYCWYIYYRLFSFAHGFRAVNNLCTNEMIGASLIEFVFVRRCVCCMSVNQSY